MEVEIRHLLILWPVAYVTVTAASTGYQVSTTSSLSSTTSGGQNGSDHSAATRNEHQHMSPPTSAVSSTTTTAETRNSFISGKQFVMRLRVV